MQHCLAQAARATPGILGARLDETRQSMLNLQELEKTSQDEAGATSRVVVRVSLIDQGGNRRSSACRKA